jgi:hypothetical protein
LGCEAAALDAERCRAFALAMMEQAIHDIEHPPTSRPGDEGDPRGWIRSDDDTPGSFRWCCDALDLEPARVRRLLNEKGENHEADPDPCC